MTAVLVADPPWMLNDQLPGNGRGATKHYPCLTLAQILGFALPALGGNAVLFLWRLASMPSEALAVARAWDFEPKTELVWIKLTKHRKRHFGMGHYLRAEHETCLIATRGKATPARHDIRSTFRAPTGVHSEKPARFYQIVEALYPTAVRYELFARRARPGWWQFGDQLGCAL
jgi:N6-adenosine-specific RNA methylase IME4